jgi:hypothetical protein
MKKFVAFFIAACIGSLGYTQSFRKGDVVVGLGGGLSIYRYQFTDVTNNIVNPRDTSGAWSFPIGVEYGITNWLSGNFTFNYNNYIEGDSATNENAKGIDFLIGVGLHVPWQLKKFDLCAKVEYGMSRFSYTFANANNNAEAKALGSALFITLNPRFYFSKSSRLGMGFWYRYSMYNYKNGATTDNLGNEAKFKLDGPGNSFGLNLFYNIHGER